MEINRVKRFLESVGVIGVTTTVTFDLLDMHGDGNEPLVWILFAVFLLLVYIWRHVLIVKEVEIVALARRSVEAIHELKGSGVYILSPLTVVFGRYSLRERIASCTVDALAQSGGVPVIATWRLVYQFDPRNVSAENWSWLIRVEDDDYLGAAVEHKVSNLLKQLVQCRTLHTLFGPNAYAEMQTLLHEKVGAELKPFGIDVFETTLTDIALPDALKAVMVELVVQEQEAILQKRRAEADEEAALILARQESAVRQIEFARYLEEQRSRMMLLEFASRHGYQRLRDMGIVAALQDHGFPPSAIPVSEWPHWFADQQQGSVTVDRSVRPESGLTS